MGPQILTGIRNKTKTESAVRVLLESNNRRSETNWANRVGRKLEGTVGYFNLIFQSRGSGMDTLFCSTESGWLGGEEEKVTGNVNIKKLTS